MLTQFSRTELLLGKEAMGPAEKCPCGSVWNWRRGRIRL